MPSHPESGEARNCVVKLTDAHGIEHSVRVRAESVYEAALRGLERLERVGWESRGEQIGFVTVEVWEEPTTHRVNVADMLRWLEGSGRTPAENNRKAKLRAIMK